MKLRNKMSIVGFEKVKSTSRTPEAYMYVEGCVHTQERSEKDIIAHV